MDRDSDITWKSFRQWYINPIKSIILLAIFDMPVLERQEEKSYSIKGGLDQNVLCRYTEITAEWKLFQFQMPKSILCITTKHKTLLYYKQLKEISVNSNLSLVILEGVYIYIMYIAYIVLLQYKQLMELLVFSMVI